MSLPTSDDFGGLGLTSSAPSMGLWTSGDQYAWPLLVGDLPLP